MSRNHLRLTAFLLVAIGLAAAAFWLAPRTLSNARRAYEAQQNRPVEQPSPRIGIDDNGLPDRPTVLPNGDPTPSAATTAIPERPGVSWAEATKKVEPEIVQLQTPPPPPVPETLLRPPIPADRSTSPRSPVRTEIAPLRYLFNNLSPESTRAQPLVFSQTGTAIHPEHFAPEGEAIQLALLDHAISNRTRTDVVAAVWEPFQFRGRVLLDVGTKILGTAAPGKYRDRLEVTFSKIVFPDGRSLPIQAVAQDVDGSTGVRGTTVGNLALQAVVPILLDAAASFSGSFKNRVLVGSSVGSGGSLQELPDLRNGAISAGEGGMAKLNRMVVEEMDQNRPYLVVSAGTRCRALLTRHLDVSGADYGK